MKVGIFSDIYLPRIGGTTVSVVNTIKFLKQANVEVKYFVPFRSEVSHDKEAIFFPPMPYWISGDRIATAGPGISKVKDKVFNAGLDIIHSFSPFFVGRLAIAMATQLKIPCVFTYQSRYIEYVHHLPFGAIFRLVPKLRLAADPMVTRLTLKTLNNFSCVIVPTLTTRDYLQKLGFDSRIEIIPVGFDIHGFRPSTTAVRSCYGIDGDSIVFLHLGRLAFEKNIPFLVRALAPVLRQIEKTHLMIVGEGDMRPPLEKLCKKLMISNKVSFCGPVQNSHVGEYYRAANIFVFSSFSETQAFVISEALISGLPVLSVRSPGPMDIIEHMQDGILVDAKLEDFTEAAFRLVQDNVLRNSLSQGAWRKGTHLSGDRYANKLIALYSSMIASN